mgnify:CR=1 FL=1
MLFFCMEEFLHLDRDLLLVLVLLLLLCVNMFVMFLCVSILLEDLMWFDVVIVSGLLSWKLLWVYMLLLLLWVSVLLCLLAVDEPFVVVDGDCVLLLLLTVVNVVGLVLLLLLSFGYIWAFMFITAFVVPCGIIILW